MKNMQRIAESQMRVVPLRDLCRLDLRQVIPGTSDAATLPYVGMEDIESGTGRFLSWPHEADVRSNTFAFDVRHVLYGKLRPYLNKVALPDRPGRCSTELLPLLPAPGVDRQYVAWLLRRPETVSAAMQDKTGSRMPRASMTQLMALTVPLPSLAKQKRIVARLDEQMAALDRAEKALAEQRAAACALTVAVSQRTFHGPESEKWPSVYIRDVCTVVNGFGFPEYLQGSTTLRYPFVKVSDMNAPGAGEVVSSAANTVDEEILHTLGARVYPAGTVIFPKVGGALLTNKKRVLGTASCFDNNVMGLVPTGLDSRFLFLWFRTVDLRTLANTQALPSIRQSAVAALGMPLPSPSEQRRIVARLDEQMTALDHAERVLADRQTDVAALRTTLLNAAFSGEI